MRSFSGMSALALALATAVPMADFHAGWSGAPTHKRKHTSRNRPVVSREKAKVKRKEQKKSRRKNR